MKRFLRCLALGALAGLALSLARAPLGASLLTLPAVSALGAALYRGAALVVVALAMARARALAAPRDYGALLVGVFAGFAGHGLLLSKELEIGGPAGLLLALALLAAGMLAAGHGPLSQEDGRPSRLELAGLAIAGAGAAIALESVARGVRLLGLGTPHDDTTFALTLLAALLAGALAFGPLLTMAPAKGRRWPALATGLALGALACLLATHLVGGLATREGLDHFLRIRSFDRYFLHIPLWDLDLAWVGRLAGDALIGARVFLVPGFVLGAAVWGTRHRLELASALIGAGLGLVVLNAWLIDATPSELSALELRCGERVALGTLVAGLGGALALLAGRARHSRLALALGLSTCLAVIAGTRLVEPPRALPISPWRTFPPQPVWAADTPEGLLTIEPAKDGELVVLLDRRQLTPEGSAAAADQECLAAAWRVLPAESRSGARVLLVGQLTPLRAFTLKSLGAARIDRTAAWHASMPAVEAELFGADEPPPGEVLAPAAAEQRLRQGEIDLVIAPPTAPRGTRAPPRPRAGSPPAVAWLFADGDLVHRNLGARVLLASDGLDHLALGVHYGESGLPAGEPLAGRTALQILSMWPFDRSPEFLREITARLALANEETAYADLTAGLRLHFAAQARSSPWETPAQSTEINGAALAHLRQAALAVDEGAEEARFLRSLWNGLAKTLVEKRAIEPIYEHLVPLAAARAPWLELERALAHADLEMLDPASAAAHLRAVIAEQPYDLDARLRLAQALEMTGDPAGAAAELARVLEVQPGRRELSRWRAMALARAGAPESGELLEELLAEDPDDLELLRYRGPGPFPPLDPSFTPFSSRYSGVEGAEGEPEHDQEHANPGP